MAFTGIGDAKAPRNIRKAQERNGTGKKYNSQLGQRIGWYICLLLGILIEFSGKFRESE